MARANSARFVLAALRGSFPGHVYVAAKGGISAASLAEHAFVRGEKHRYVHRGEELIRGGLRRQAIAVCPRCLAGDIATARSWG